MLGSMLQRHMIVLSALQSQSDYHPLDLLLSSLRMCVIMLTMDLTVEPEEYLVESYCEF